MPLRILSCDAAHAAQALQVYARATTGVKHGFPASEREMRAWLKARSPRLCEEKTVLALDEGESVGLLRWGRGGPNARPESWYSVEPGDGVILALFVESGREDVAEALADHALGELGDPGVEPIWAFEDELGPPFYNGGFGQASVSHAEALTALTARGFVVHDSELHLTCDPLPADSSASADPRGRILSERLPGGERSVELLGADGARMAQCVWESMSAKSAHRAARRCGYVWWLGVEEPYRGRGLGRALMGVVAREMRANGHAVACLTTNAANHRALGLYLSLGYRVVDCSLVLRSRAKKSSIPGPKLGNR